jgi:hypothetical protein
MLPAEFQNAAILDLLPIVEGISPANATSQGGYLRINDLVALPVNQVARHIDGRVDGEILDEAGVSIGTLCLTAKLNSVGPNALTKWQYVAYLADISVSNVGQPHSFQKNYLILKAAHFDEYLKKYHDTAPVWGGFSHSPSSSIASNEHTVIRALPDIIIPTKYHHMAFSRYVSASNAFDRFLRLYHNLELIFDFMIMKSIQKLGDDMVGFGALSRAHGRTELDRLKYILVECCESWEEIAAKFHGLVNFESKAAEIFQEHAKDGNPLDDLRWDKVIEACQSGQTAAVNFTTAKLCKTNEYARFVASIAAYWIYRVRSSIAHSRVSEFLFEDSDEKFIVDFAERLLLEVVRQVLSSAKLASLIK